MIPILVMLTGDLAIFYSALYFALLLRFGFINLHFYLDHSISFLILFGVFVCVAYIVGLYDKLNRHGTQEIFNTVIITNFIFTIISISLFYFLPFVFGVTPKTTLLLFMLLFTPLIFIWHRYVPFLLHSSYDNAVLVVNDGDEWNLYGYNIVYRFSVTDDFDDIVQTIKKLGVKVVLFDFNRIKDSTVLGKMYRLLFHGIRFIDVCALREEEYGRIELEKVNELWILNAFQHKTMKVFLMVKYLIDIVLVFIVIPFFFLILPLVAIIILLQDGGKIFFRQKRTGLYGKDIYIYKFRTMSGADSGKEALKSKLKVTPFGKILRKLRIDELPQIFNILRGDLSFIGPRPEIPEMIEEYQKEIPFYNVSNIVRPGLTGWAQVTHERDPHHGIDIDATREKLEYDLYYIKHMSIFLEIKIILKTAKMLLHKIFTD
jgi:lipopolysaccharide/colanic/teichoic acid biosynthesis glycosyltransferase